MKIIVLRIKNILKRIFNKDCSLSRISYDEFLTGRYPKEYRESLKKLKFAHRELKQFIKEAELILDSHSIENPNKDYGVALYFLEKFIKSSKCVLGLSKNGFYDEALIIVGNIIEGYSSMKFMIKNKKVQDYLDYKELQKIKRHYINRATFKGVNQDEDDSIFIYLLNKAGKKFIKHGKNHKDVIGFLKNPMNSYEEKFKKIKNSYYEYWFKDTINSVMKQAKINETIRITYSQYCSVNILIEMIYFFVHHVKNTHLLHHIHWS